jgi:hypothetical protein
MVMKRSFADAFDVCLALATLQLRALQLSTKRVKKSARGFVLRGRSNEIVGRAICRAL